VLGSSAGGITIWGASGPRIVGQGSAHALNDLASVVLGQTSGPTRWDNGVPSLLQHPGGAIGGAVPIGALTVANRA
jgi:hypothetical protein